VFTGETGAGKSILIDALSLVIGERASAELLREGAKVAEVAAEFEPNAHAVAWLQANAFSCDELLLRRTVDAQGKSRAYINGSPATAGQLRELGEHLVDIFGQHAHQSLMRRDALMQLFDECAKADSTPVAVAFKATNQAQARLTEATAAQATLARERERLRFDLDEINKLAPKEAEWDEISAQHQRLSHSAELLDTAQSAVQQLDEQDNAVLAKVAALATRLRHAQTLDATLKDAALATEAAEVQLQEAVHALNAYLARLEIDPHALQALDTRMSAWMSLARRHRVPPRELAGLAAAKRLELIALDAQQDLEALNAALEASRAAYTKAAATLSRQRSAQAPRLAKAVTAAMQELGMQGGRFEVQLAARTEPSAHGAEDVDFLIAGHAGSTAKPIGKVASGGELSRIALAIAVTTSAQATVPTLIFDEVDAGIGGVTAQSVGRLMRKLAANRQVLCVTHLPQVAAFAHQHLQVSKAQRGRVTVSAVQALDANARVAEIGRMLGASEANAGAAGSARAHAEQLLQSAQIV
jgi:DNA repair protein RecN (Recombination protein N)